MVHGLDKKRLQLVFIMKTGAQVDGDTVSLRSVTMKTEDDDQSDAASVKTLTEEDGGEVERKEDVTKDYDYKVDPDTCSLAGTEDRDPEQYYKENGLEMQTGEPEKTLTAGEESAGEPLAAEETAASSDSVEQPEELGASEGFKDNSEAHSKVSQEETSADVKVESTEEVSEDVEVEYADEIPADIEEEASELKALDPDSVSVKSYSAEGDYILSLHQKVPKPEEEEAATNGFTENVEDESKVPYDTETKINEVQAEKIPSSRDFESIVKENMSKYKSEKNKSNADVLDSIVREEGADIPNVANLLAWAKGTRKKKTETFVVRKKNREELLRQHFKIINNLNFLFCV